jgi:hypothetical protein
MELRDSDPFGSFSTDGDQSYAMTDVPIDQFLPNSRIQSLRLISHKVAVFRHMVTGSVVVVDVPGFPEVENPAVNREWLKRAHSGPHLSSPHLTPTLKD